jgi:hypothetical protein
MAIKKERASVRLVLRSTITPTTAQPLRIPEADELVLPLHPWGNPRCAIFLCVSLTAACSAYHLTASPPSPSTGSGMDGSNSSSLAVSRLPDDAIVEILSMQVRLQTLARPNRRPPLLQGSPPDPARVPLLRRRKPRLMPTVEIAPAAVTGCCFATTMGVSSTC